MRASNRSLQLLAVLLSAPGRVFAREELVARIWQDTIVDETSLRVQVSALRRALGDGRDSVRYVLNVSGRGYTFVAPVKILPPAMAGPLPPSLPVPAGRAEAPRPPARLTLPIGREEVVARIGDTLAMRRLVSVVGVGGMGKTTVALAVAREFGPGFAQGWHFVNLATLADPAVVMVEVAQSCGLDVARGEPGAALEAALRHRHVLIVLDNCEHVIDAAAALVDRLLRACPRLHVLATSREPLELEAEWLIQLPPLGLPADSWPLPPEAMLSYPAVQLFVERAAAAGGTYRLTAENVDAVRQICTVLDGIPLAIELAAARVNLLGERGLLLRLENALDLLTRGRRTAAERHQTLHAVLDWSYELLDETERLALRRLSVFHGRFDLESAIAVVSSAEMPRAAVIEAVLSLCAKSLLVIDVGDDTERSYRLLYIVRLYAQRALTATPEASRVHRRHAEFVLELLVDANATQPALRDYSRSLSRPSVVVDLRAALAWTLVEENDLVLGMELIAEPRGMYLAAELLDECERHVVIAVEKIDRAGMAGTPLELRLQQQATYLSGQSLGSRSSHRSQRARTRELADRLGSTNDKLVALYGIATAAYGHGDYLQSLACCDEVRELARGEFSVLSVAVGDRLAALNLHALGRHDEAERLACRVMTIDGNKLPWSFLTSVPFAVSMSIQLARIHWLRGNFRQAWIIVQESLGRPEDVHAHAQCQPLGMAAIPVALWKGELQAAAAWTVELMDHATRANLSYWRAYGVVYSAVVEGRPLLSGSPEAVLLEQSVQLMDIHATLQSAAPRPLTLARVRAGEVGWCAPEVLRLAALARLDPQDEASRRRCLGALREALALSVEQGARFWSLRILVSTVLVAAAEGAERAAAIEHLRALVARIDDGSPIPDLLVARRLAEPPSTDHQRAVAA